MAEMRTGVCMHVCLCICTTPCPIVVFYLVLIQGRVAHFAHDGLTLKHCTNTKCASNLACVTMVFAHVRACMRVCSRCLW